MSIPDDSSAPAGTWLRDGDTDMTAGQKYACLIAVLLLILAALFTLREFLPALIWTVVFAVALWPIFQRLAQRWPSHRRALLPGVFVFGVTVVFVLPIVIIAVPLAADAHAAVQWWQQVRQSGIAPPAFLMRLPHGAQLTALWAQELGQPEQISVLTTGAMHGGGAKVAGVIGRETIHRLVLFGFMLLGLFFFLRSAEDVIKQLKVGSRRTFGSAGEDIAQQIINSVHGTVNGLVLVGLGEGLLLGVAYLVAGVPHPTLFGLLTAILAMVPFGAAVAIIAASLALAAKGQIIAAVVIVVTGGVVTFVADHFIRPVLIGGATRLPFIWVLLGILGGVSAWGLVGLFVGPAIMAALILVWREWIGAEKGPINPEAFEVIDEIG
jgi:predicted PurR-regulated permease PerM